MKNLINRNNYLLINKFLENEKLVRNLSALSVTRYRSYFKRLLNWAKDESFRNAYTINPNFISYLSNQVSSNNKEPFSKETWRKILGLTSRFFTWAKKEYPKEFKNVPEIWIKSLHIPKSIQQKNDTQYVSLEEVIKLTSIPNEPEDLATIRDRAAVAFLYVSGCRAGAFVTLPIKSIDLKKNSVKISSADGVKVKNNKSRISYLLSIPALYKSIIQWDQIVRNKLPEMSVWYAPIKNNWGHQELVIQKPGNYRQQGLNKRIKKLCKLANIPYMSAHKYRRGHAHFGISHSKDIREYKIVSKNLGHSTMTITDQYYSKFNEYETKNTIQNLGKNPMSTFNLTDEEIISEFANFIKNRKNESGFTASNYQQD